MSKLSTACHFPSKISWDSIVLLGPCEHREQVCSNLLCSSHTLSYWSLKVPTRHHIAKNSLRILKDVLLRLRYKKIANTLKLSRSTVAKIIQRFRRAGSTQNRPRVGRPKKLNARAEHHIQMLSLKDRRRSAVSIAAEIEEVGGQLVSAQTIRRTLHQIGVHGCHPRRKPLLKTIHKKARKQFAEDMSTEHMDYWNHVLWSDEVKINLFGSDGFRHVWRRPGEEYKDKCVMATVKHGDGNVMVWGCPSVAGVGELHFIEGNMNSNMYCERLQQSMSLFLQKLGRRAVFQHDNDPKHTSKMTTALLKRLGIKVMD